MKRREVKSCFMVLDDDGSNEVTPFEFKQACRAYGFGGPAKLAFKVPFWAVPKPKRGVGHQQQGRLVP